MTLLGLSFGMWDLFPWPGTEPEPPTLVAWSLRHWTSREVPYFLLLLRWYSKENKIKVPNLGHHFWNNSIIKKKLNSVQFSHSVVSDSLPPYESQHARPPCPSPTPGVHSSSCPLSRWCHPAISSSGVPFSSCPQSLQASGSFPMSQLVAWGGQSIGVSASANSKSLPCQEKDPSKRDCSHPENSPALSLIFHRIWMFILRTVRLSLT